MPYQFLDANGSILTAGSSVISNIHYPVVKISDPVSVVGALTVSGNPSISGTVNIGNANLNVSGSVVGFQGTNPWVVQSIVGSYAEDTGHTTGDKGLFALNVRNDTLASITSADLDYSPQAVGPTGEVIMANAPLTKWVQGVASCFTGVIQPVIAAQGASIFTYITSGQVANASNNNVYLTLFGATSSVVGYLPVPANSGAIPLMTNGWKSNANGAFSASVSGVASVFLSFQGFISKT